MRFITINLQILIVFWWIGAIVAGIALAIPNYPHYVTVGSVGWSVVIVTSGLIVYEIKRIKEEDKKKSTQ
jgi:FtsH-binding integral membrane protein